jgi:drug/metabolite transporter (DMT)-like permease
MHFLMFWATVFWASNIVAGKEAVGGFGAMGLAQLRLAGAALLFLMLFLARRSWPDLRLSRRQWLVLTAVAFNGLTLNQICFINGLAWTSVAHTGLIVALGPVMVLALSCLLRLELLTLPKFLGMLISFGGVAILTLGGAEKGSTAHWQGDLIVLAGSASFAYYTIQVKGIAHQYDALTLNTLTFALGSLLMIPFAARSVLHIGWAHVALGAWGGLAFMIVLGTVAAYLFYAFALTELPASRVAAFAYLQPVVAALLGVWLLGERITLRVVAGGALILLGVYLAERERGELE